MCDWRWLLAIMMCLLPDLVLAAGGTLAGNQPELAQANRISWGITPAEQEHIQAHGYPDWLRGQLTFVAQPTLPDEIQQEIDAMDISRLTLADILRAQHTLQQHIHTADNADAQAALKKLANQRRQQLILQSSERRLLRAVYSPQQLQEVLTWFWFNHFNVFAPKAQDALLVADYEENAIRPHVLGRFGDLVWATLTHPAMLVYLDNQQNDVNAGNENYARELMELHTLGVNGGYTQQDVQALAKILTGATFRLPENCPSQQHTLAGVPQADISPLFCFLPRQHDESAKQFLHQDFPANGGADELVRAVTLLIDSPATAQHVCDQLASYFLGHSPSPALLQHLSHTFRQSDGDIADTLAILFRSEEFRHSNDQTFKDPVRYVVSSVRLLYGSMPIRNARPMVNWINQLGEGLYNHVSPDGYPLTGKIWLSDDQISKRLLLARQLPMAAGALYVSEDTIDKLQDTDPTQLQQLRQAARTAHPIDSFRIRDWITPLLDAHTRDTLDGSHSLEEWDSLLLSAPAWMYD